MHTIEIKNNNLFNSVVSRCPVYKTVRVGQKIVFHLIIKKLSNKLNSNQILISL